MSVLTQRCVVDPSRTRFVFNSTQKSVTRIATIGSEGERVNKQSDQSDSKRSGQRSRWKTQARLDGRKQSHMNDHQAKENMVRRRPETGQSTTTGCGVRRLSVVKNRVHMTAGVHSAECRHCVMFSGPTQCLDESSRCIISWLVSKMTLGTKLPLFQCVQQAVRMISFLSAPSRSTQGVDHCEPRSMRDSLQQF